MIGYTATCAVVFILLWGKGYWVLSVIIVVDLWSNCVRFLQSLPHGMAIGLLTISQLFHKPHAPVVTNNVSVGC